MSETSINVDLSNAINETVGSFNSGFVKVDILKYDPVLEQETKKPVIRATDNPIIGYFGPVRDAGTKKHTGYDYKAKTGAPVKAVKTGEIAIVRFGRKLIKKYYERTDDDNIYHRKHNFVCLHFLELKEEVVFDKEICKRCKSHFFSSYSEKELTSEQIQFYEKNNGWKNYTIEEDTVKKLINEKEIEKKVKWSSISDNCFGIQVWLRIPYDFDISRPALYDRVLSLPHSTHYAYYAHLSKLNKNIITILLKLKETGEIEELCKKGDTTVILESPIKTKAGEDIGESGCTGNAVDMDESNEHLHFECREEIEAVPGSQVTPNQIVKTPFVIVKKTNHKEIVDIQDAINKKENEWLKKVRRTDKDSIKRNKFQLKCYNEEWGLHRGKMTEKEFIDKVWLGEMGVKKKKWKSFEFVDETSLSETEAKKWTNFVTVEKAKYDEKWWNDFKKQHVVVEDTRNQIIAFK